MDWIYKNSFQQSSEVKDLDQLRAEIDKIKNVDDLKATDQATGLILKPEVIERLNLSTEDGIHDRRLYLKEEHHWIEKQLVPWKRRNLCCSTQYKKDKQKIRRNQERHVRKYIQKIVVRTLFFYFQSATYHQPKSASNYDAQHQW